MIKKLEIFYTKYMFSNCLKLITIVEPDTASTFVDIEGYAYDELQWQCMDDSLSWDITVQCDSDMFLPILMRENGAADTRVAGTYHYHTDHLGSAHWITKGYEAVQFIHYMPYGEMWYNQQGSAYNERFKYTGKERDSETGYDYFGARNYMSDGPLWLSPDPLMDKYPHISPYAYCSWNPLKYVDPNGKWIAVASNDDTGTSYTVVSGSVDVTDCNVYVVGNDYDSNIGIKPQGANVLAQTATPYSFCNENGNVVTGAVINMNDKSGDAFLARFQNNEISLLGYVMPTWLSNESGHNGGGSDFKYGNDVNRGMPLGILDSKIGTARDVGNFAAGYLAARKGLSYGVAMWAFDMYHNYQNKVNTGEPHVSRWAQILGFGYGSNARRASNLNSTNIYNAYR